MSDSKLSSRTVLVHGRTAEEAQAATDKLVATAGIPAEHLCPFGADFSRLEEVERLAHRVVVEHPRLDVLVNNAAIAAPERHTVTVDRNEIALRRPVASSPTTTPCRRPRSGSERPS